MRKFQVEIMSRLLSQEIEIEVEADDSILINKFINLIRIIIK